MARPKGPLSQVEQEQREKAIKRAGQTGRVSSPTKKSSGAAANKNRSESISGRIVVT